ncbi:MAG: NUDIX domain-containing protein [Chloroflexi bacterium]|jgi:8-oxo-dGTP pyrophosphatase MutT (NUDIX family)|nr:NUDIX domain-containing protein [Chloroflexota bacterium]
METAYRSIFDCARRETFEETGLDVKLLRIVYIREFIDEGNDTHYNETDVIADIVFRLLSIVLRKL